MHGCLYTSGETQGSGTQLAWSIALRLAGVPVPASAARRLWWVRASGTEEGVQAVTYRRQACNCIRAWGHAAANAFLPCTAGVYRTALTPRGGNSQRFYLLLMLMAHQAAIRELKEVVVSTVSREGGFMRTTIRPGLVF